MVNKDKLYAWEGRRIRATKQTAREIERMLTETTVDAVCECGDTVSFTNWRKHVGHKLAEA